MLNSEQLHQQGVLLTKGMLMSFNKNALKKVKTTFIYFFQRLDMAQSKVC